MKTMITTAVATVVLSFQGTGVAQQTNPSDQEAAEGIPPTIHQEEVTSEVVNDHFQRLDEDGSGSISEQEAQSVTALSDNWSKFDKDGDGSLNKEEFTEYDQVTSAGDQVASAGAQGEVEEEIPATQHQEQATKGDLVGQLDTDGDGMVSQQEGQAETRLAENWDQYDQNADGMLDSQELDRFEQEMLETEEAE